MTKIAGSGSGSISHGSRSTPNVMDPHAEINTWTGTDTGTLQVRKIETQKFIQKYIRRIWRLHAPVLRIRNIYPGSRIQVQKDFLIPDPHPHQRIEFNPKHCF
jgi:hypothetical protein